MGDLIVSVEIPILLWYLDKAELTRKCAGQSALQAAPGGLHTLNTAHTSRPGGQGAFGSTQASNSASIGLSSEFKSAQTYKKKKNEKKEFWDS